MNKMTRRQFASFVSAIGASTYVGGVDAAGDRIKVGQIGVGHSHASGKMQAMRKLKDTYEVVGVADPNMERAKKAVGGGAYEGLKAMSVEQLLNTSGLSAVAVETDVPKLVATAKTCIQAGKHIHLDKPAGESLPAFQQLCAMADERKLTIQMGYMLRYNPAFELLFRAVREGWLGEIHELDAGVAVAEGR